MGYVCAVVTARSDYKQAENELEPESVRAGIFWQALDRLYLSGYFVISFLFGVIGEGVEMEMASNVPFAWVSPGIPSISTFCQWMFHFPQLGWGVGREVWVYIVAHLGGF